MIDTVEALKAAGVVLAAGLVFWQTHRASKKAEQAAHNAHPIANGWGTKVAGDLTYLRQSLDHLHERQTSNDHRQLKQDERIHEAVASSSRAEQHARTAAEQSAATAAGLTAHLADHSSEAMRR